MKVYKYTIIKIFFLSILIVISLMIVSCGSKSDIEVSYSEGLAFEKIEDGYIVSGIGDCIDTVVSIPNRYMNETVVGIKEYAFMGLKNIVGVKISSSIERIGKFAFFGCCNVVDFEISNNTKIIEKSALAFRPTESDVFNFIDNNKVYNSMVSIEEIVDDGSVSLSFGIIIYQNDGYAWIVTCGHGSSNSSKYTIYLNGRSTVVSCFSNDVVYDKMSNLALIKIKTDEDLHCAIIQGNTTVEIGQPIMNLGINLNHEQFYQTGIITALDVLTYHIYYNRISNGDFNMLGVTSIYDYYGNLIGIGHVIDDCYKFIPIKTVVDIVNELNENGYVTGRPLVGISIHETKLENREYGLYVAESLIHSNIQVGDRIIKIGNKSISSLSQFGEVLMDYKPGNLLELVIERAEIQEDGKIDIKVLTETITLDERKD